MYIYLCIYVYMYIYMWVLSKVKHYHLSSNRWLQFTESGERADRGRRASPRRSSIRAAVRTVDTSIDHQTAVIDIDLSPDESVLMDLKALLVEAKQKVPPVLQVLQTGDETMLDIGGERLLSVLLYFLFPVT